MMKQRFTLFASLALMLLVWLVPKEASAQTTKCPNGMVNLDNVKYHLGCGDWFEVTFKGHPGYSYSLTIDGILLGTYTGYLGEYTAGTAKSKFSAGDTVVIVQSCNINGTTDNDIFKAVLPPDLNMPGTWAFVADALSATNTPWMASEFTPESPTDIPEIVITPDHGKTWSPSCMGKMDGKWTFGATVTSVSAYGGLDSLRYELKSPLSGSGTILSGNTITIDTLKAGTYSANIIAYAGSCTDTVMVMNVVYDGTNEPTVACQDRIHVSVDAQCMADLHPRMMLAGVTDLCGLTLMDSIVLKHKDGTPLDPSIFTRQGDTLRIENASAYIHGPALIAEIHSTNGSISNYCWGELIFEDKLPPVLDCDTLKVIACYHFDGTSTAHIKVHDCDPNPYINIVNEKIITDCHAIGGDSIIKRIIRTFNATDSWGNTSATCSDTLDIRRLDAIITSGATGVLDIPGLKYPLNRVSIDGGNQDTSAFVCDSRYPFADYDHDHIPDPVDYIIENGDTLYGAGVPYIDTTINGVPWQFKFHPSNYIHIHDNVAKLLETCKTVVTYTDLRLPRIGCVEKVVRTWTIREWACGQETVRSFPQTIEIVDTIGPNFDLPVNMKVSTNQKTCERYMRIPPPIGIHDYCKKSLPGRVIVNVINDGVYIGTLSTVDGTFDLENGGTLNIPLGSNLIEYNVFDNCHNVTIDTSYIVVVDETAPVVICKEFLVVGIADDGENGNGEVWVRAESFNNGSYDDCGLKDHCVARMDDLEAFDALEDAEIGGRLTEHGPWYVPLSELNTACDRIFYKSGTNDDGVDYIFRAHLCTPQMMMCCEDVGKSVMVVFRVTDKAGNTNECMVEVEAQDKRHPIVHCPPDLTIDCRFDFAADSMLNIFGNVVEEGQQEALGIPEYYVLGVEYGKELVDGVFFGNCSATVTVTTDEDLNTCRQGVITRTFIVTANNGNTSKCKQYITLSRAKVLKTEDIVFPNDTTFESCADPSAFPPEVTGFPSVDESDCTLVGWAYEDLTVRFNDNNGDACFKIIRQWTIIDWCKQPSFTIGTGNQIIKINDMIDPVITNSSDGECAAKTADIIDNQCIGGFIELSQSATDNCTDADNLKWNIGIDLDNDGDIDISHQLTGGTADISGDYPIGTHRIIWEVRDQCGNQDVCEQLFTIRNLKQPTPICITTITGSLMPVDDGSSQNGTDDDDIAGDGIADGGMLTVWASEYDIGSSSHPCDYELVYSFSADSIVPNREFTCFDLGLNNISIHVLAVEYDFEGNATIVSSDFCSVIFDLDDNNNTCDTVTFNPANLLITGNIRTESNENVPTVAVALLGSNSGASTFDTETDRGGMYAFVDMEFGGSYNIVPELDIDILNGVSTLDLVLIQKHILGLDALPSAYKIIAGDINKDGRISAVDLVELRKVILGVSDKFNNNNSWRFIDDGYTFISPYDPLSESFKENYDISGLTRTMIIDFIGVKVGDVNGNVNVAGLLTAPRSLANLVLENTKFSAGEIIRVPVSFKGIQNLLGYQFTLEYDQTVISFAGFESGTLALSSENFGVQGIDEGYLTSSWGSVNAMDVTEGDAFVLEFTALRSGTLSEVIDLTSSVTSSEAYNSDQDVLGLSLEFSLERDGVDAGYELFQNMPNPFSQTTSIGFMLPKDADATISIYDVTGKLLKAYSGSFAKGLNTIMVNKSELTTTGVLYYTLETDEFTSTRSMVLIK